MHPGRMPLFEMERLWRVHVPAGLPLSSGRPDTRVVAFARVIEANARLWGRRHGAVVARGQAARCRVTKAYLGVDWRELDELGLLRLARIVGSRRREFLAMETALMTELVA